MSVSGETTARLLAETLLQRLRPGTIGLRAINLPRFDANTLYQALQPSIESGKLRLALLGYKLASGLDATCVTTDVEQAVAWRNDSNNRAPIVALLNAETPLEKTHSLEMLEPLTDAELRQSFARWAEQEARHRGDEAAERLWSVLARKDVATTLGLVAEQVARLYAALDAGTSPGDALPYLGLLRDSAATAGDNAENLRRRLGNNRTGNLALVRRLRQLSKSDMRQLARSLGSDAARFQPTFAAIQRFTQRPSPETLQDPALTFEAVKELFEAPKAPDKEPTTAPPAFESALLENLLQVGNDSEDRQILETIAKDENDLFWEPATSEAEPDNLHEKEQFGVSYLLPNGQEAKLLYTEPKDRHPLETLMRQAVQEEVWGGTIELREAGQSALPISRLLDGRTPLPSLQPLRPVHPEPTTLLSLLQALDEALLPAEEAALTPRFRVLDEARRALAPYRIRFLYQPAHALADPEMFRRIERYLMAYEQLARQVQATYPLAQARFPETIEEATAQFLALDAILLARGGLAREQGGNAALLTTLHPLYLWKWLELAQRLRQHGDDLSDEGRALLQDVIPHLPALLNTFLLHPAMFAGSQSLEELRLVLAGESRNPRAERTMGVPFYEPVAQHVPSGEGVDRDRIIFLIERLLSLYPPARISLSLAMIDPPLVRPFLEACYRLSDEGKLRGAYVTVYRTDAADPYEHKTLDDSDLLARFRNDPRWEFRFQPTSYEEVVRALQQSGAHLTILCDPSEAVVQPILREANTPYPFGVPVHLSYDAIQDTARRVPVATGGIFDVYTGVRNALSNELSRRTLGVGSRTALKESTLQELLAYSRWLVILDHPNGTLELPKLGRLWLWQPVGRRTLRLHSADERRWQRHLDDLLRSFQPPLDAERIQPLLIEAILVLRDGLLGTIKNPTEGTDEEAITHDAANPPPFEALLAVVTTLRHYRAEHPDVAFLWLRATDLKQAFAVPEFEARVPLLAVWQEGDQLCLDLLLVQLFGEHEALPLLLSEHVSLDRLQGVAERLEALFAPDAGLRLLEPIRREALRDHLSVAVFAPTADAAPAQVGHRARRASKAQWADTINDLFAHSPRLRLRSVRITLDARRAGNPQRLPDMGYPREVLTLSGSVLHAAPDWQEQVRPGVPPVEQPRNETGSRSTEQPSDAQSKNGQGASAQQAQPQHEGVVQPDPAQHPRDTAVDPAQIQAQAKELLRVLLAYGVAVAEIDVAKSQVGPRVVRYWLRLQPPAGRLSEVQKYAVDLARELGSRHVPLIDNIPGEQYVGIDLPRDEPQTVPFAPALAKLPVEQPQSLTIALGKNAAGEDVVANLVKMPHLLVAGTTGSGKTMFLTTLIASLALRHSPAQLQLLLVDPKQTDFLLFDQLPHLHGGRVVYDPEEATEMLRWIVVSELERRTSLLTGARCPNNLEYNRRHPASPIPWLVVVVDEFADIMLTLSKQERDTFEKQVNRLAAIGRAKGIHLVLATQRPTTDVITGTIKANFPARISFRLPSLTDSRTILDRGGAEHLLGQGDMLTLLDGELQRLQGYYAPYDEIEQLLQDVQG